MNQLRSEFREVPSSVHGWILTMFYVYVLYFCNLDKFYIGYTSDLKRRIEEHSSGNTYSTARLGDFKLIFYESFSCKTDAFRREQYFKTTKGKKALRIILRDSLKA